MEASLEAKETKEAEGAEEEDQVTTVAATNQATMEEVEVEAGVERATSSVD